MISGEQDEMNQISKLSAERPEEPKPFWDSHKPIHGAHRRLPVGEGPRRASAPPTLPSELCVLNEYLRAYRIAKASLSDAEWRAKICEARAQAAFMCPLKQLIMPFLTPG